MVSSGIDARALTALRQKMKAAASVGGLYDRMKAALAAEALTQVALGFRESRDPEGEPWAPTIFRKGKPLRDTGRLLNSFATEILSDGFRIGTKTLYARVHQYGATIVPKKGKFLRFPIGRGKKRKFIFTKKVVIPRRQMVPSPGHLGPIWAKAFRRVVDFETRRYWKKR